MRPCAASIHTQKSTLFEDFEMARETRLDHAEALLEIANAERAVLIQKGEKLDTGFVIKR